MTKADLSLSEARRIALAAQGFDRPRPKRGRVRDSHVSDALRRIGLVQIDYVNVLAPAHYLVFFSRLGPYRNSLLGDLVRSREFTEQWAHEASILPVDSWPLLAHRRETHRVRPYGFERFLERNRTYVDWVLEEVRRRGPLIAADLPAPGDSDRRIKGDAWVGTVPRAVLEAHFGRGALAVAERRPNFARAYDLAERIIPREHYGRSVTREDSRRELLRIAARAHGVGTIADFADYYRMPAREARPRIAELVEAGELKEVRVEGWREAAYLHRESKAPKKIDAAALLSPFDPAIWFRPRTARLFGFDYRLEIYSPPEKRKWGYYVLPFLFGERLTARVDLKADRSASRLLVLASYVEAGHRSSEVAEALAVELRVMADWLELESVSVASRGNLARALARTCTKV